VVHSFDADDDDDDDEDDDDDDDDDDDISTEYKGPGCLLCL